MFIRRLSAKDATAFHALRLEGLQRHPEAFGASYEDEAFQPLEWVVERLAATMVFGGYDTTGALRGVIGLRQEAAPKTKHRTTIWGVYVSAGSRGTGLAPQLVQAAITAARGTCTTVLLAVVSSNLSARRLYERAVFTLRAVDRKALCVNGTFHDKALMRLDFE